MDKRLKKMLLLEGLVALAFIAVSLAIFYISLIYPPFPPAVTYTEAGKTRLDMPFSEVEQEGLIPDFVTGAVYRRSDLEAVFKERAKITKLAMLVLAGGYPAYLVARFLLARLIVWIFNIFARKRAQRNKKGNS